MTIPLWEKPHRAKLFRIAIGDSDSVGTEFPTNLVAIFTGSLYEARWSRRIKARCVQHAAEEAVVGVAAKSFKSGPRATRTFGALSCFIVVLVLAGRVSRAKHPVPLDPKADPSTCVTCHEDKTKGKSVHSAIAMGCTSCHEIRVN